MNPELPTISFADQSLILLPSGAIYSPSQQTLWVADLHLGKAASYRRLGQPVPQGTTTQTLNQLTMDIGRYHVKHLIVLGDFLHGPLVHQSASTLNAITQWRSRHTALEITLIRGNHDDRAGDPPITLNIHVVDQPFEFGSITCCHDDQAPDVTASSFVMSGHLHPVAVVHGKARERLRLPCFVVGRQQVVLPAYGAFTGGHLYKPTRTDSVYVIAGQSVFKLAGSS